MRETSIVNWRKGVASFFAFIMTFQAMSGILDVMAIEMGKIKPDRSYGDYYENDICPSTLTLNKDNTIIETERVKKDAVVYQVKDEYEEDLEVVEKRTENSKTYKLPDGSYVQETYFEPVHIKEGNQFVDIDNSLENVSRKKSSPLYENKSGVYDFQMYNQTMVMKNKNKEELKITFKDAALDLYDIKDNVVLFSEVYKNIDLEHRLDGDSVSSQFYINGTITQENISYTIDKGELKLQEELDALLL